MQGGDGGLESIDNYRLNPPPPTVQMQGGGDGGLESIDNYRLNPPFPMVQMQGGVMVDWNPLIIMGSTLPFPQCKDPGG